MSNASVSNVNVTSENAQFIEFRGDAKLSGVIKFVGAKGVVKIHNDAKTKIDKSQVINGSIEYEVSRSTQKSTRQSEPVFKEEKLHAFYLLMKLIRLLRIEIFVYYRQIMKLVWKCSKYIQRTDIWIKT